ncbi:Scr1 family TA system antitoxin-like transcriptional regulator [Streptomyces sp. NPDC127068]|uniref:helix-turn-helix domain-containing protein n=1 Tax=Streptomyces sp. NPDC127068 TaxID=3347127 RepID=UPI0036617487
MNRKELDPDQSPNALFGQRLRMLRDERGWTQDELAKQLRCSGTHISAVETGRRSPTPHFARNADRILGTGNRFEQLSQRARQTAILDGFPQFVVHEERAIEIRLFELGIVPGLLQTPEYAAAIASGAVQRGAITDQQAEERLSLLSRRQASLERSPAPMVHAVLDESCIRRPVGGPKVMAAQLRRLEEFAALPSTIFQVAPYELGERRAFDLPLYILTMRNLSVLSYAESAHQGHLERGTQSVLNLLTAYHQLQAESLAQAASVDMINQLRKGTP